MEIGVPQQIRKPGQVHARKDGSSLRAAVLSVSDSPQLPFSDFRHELQGGGKNDSSYAGITKSISVCNVEIMLNKSSGKEPTRVPGANCTCFHCGR